jgi:Retinal pigment epithelial membrane protein
VIAVEFAVELEQPIHRLQIALHHHRMRNDPRLADAGDLQLQDTWRWINFELFQHLGDDLSYALDRERLDARHEEAPEGDGWLLTVAFRGEERRSDLLVFEAGGIDRGPIATVHLSHRVPFGFHGNWVNGAV